MLDYLYVTDYITQNIYEIPVYDSEETDLEELLNTYGFSIDTVSIMWTTHKCTINSLKPYNE